MPAALGPTMTRGRWMAAFGGLTISTLGFAGSPQGAVTVPLEIRDNFPVLTVRIDGQELPLMYDLGGDFDLVLTDKALALVRTSPVEGTYTFSDVKGNIIEAPMFEVREVDVAQGSDAFIGLLRDSHRLHRLPGQATGAQALNPERSVGAPLAALRRPAHSRPFSAKLTQLPSPTTK